MYLINPVLKNQNRSVWIRRMYLELFIRFAEGCRGRIQYFCEKEKDDEADSGNDVGSYGADPAAGSFVPTGSRGGS